MIVSHVYQVNGIGLDSPLRVTFEAARDIGPDSALRCADLDAEAKMIAEIDRCRDAGDTAGGAFEVIARGLPVGLGSYVQWDRKLDGRLAQAMMSIPAIKGVGIGIGPRAASVPGSQMHDEIVPAPGRTKPPIGVARPTNNAGGLEGGVTNGEDLRVSGFMKPIATLMKPLRSVDLVGDERGAGRHRAERRLRYLRRRSRRRSGGQPRAGRRVSREVQRRLARRDRAQLRQRHRAAAGEVPGEAGEAGLPRRSARVIRPILKFGEAPLHERAAEVGELTSDIQKLIDDMIETMYAAPGIGLAAPQVGVSLRIFVIDLSVGRNAEDLMVFINPEFLELEGMQLEEEGCLSVPGFNATVARPMRALVSGLDRNGQMRTVEGKDLLARAFQHEMDHLDGKLFLDRVRGIKRDLIVKKIRKLSRAGKW